MSPRTRCTRVRTFAPDLMFTRQPNPRPTCNYRRGSYYPGHPCGSAKCSLECRNEWAYRRSVILRENARLAASVLMLRITPRPQGYFWTTWIDRIKQLKAALGYQWIEWVETIEFTNRGFHHNMLLRSEELNTSQRELRKLVRSILPRSIASYYLARIRTSVRIYDYIVKYGPDYAGKVGLPPKAFPIPIISYSSRYLVEPARTLWNEYLAARTAGRRRRR